MAKAGCMLIAWGIESANEAVLKKAHKGYRLEQAGEALTWAKQAGIMNWGYFIIGLPGETVQSIQETIALSKKLPLDIALFHVAAPYPGTPFFFEVIENGWFRPGTNWEEVDMDAGYGARLSRVESGRIYCTGSDGHSGNGRSVPAPCSPT